MIHVAPLLIDAAEAARMLSLTVSRFHSLRSAGQIPLPVFQQGRTVRWLADELRRWCEAGCPPQDRWKVESKGQ